jgi:hypothetical protein
MNVRDSMLSRGGASARVAGSANAVCAVSFAFVSSESKHLIRMASSGSIFGR